MKIRSKLILANLFIVLFLLGSVTYMLMIRSSELVLERAIENASLSLGQVSSNLDNKLESYEVIANTLFLNSSLNMMIGANYADPRDAYAVYFEQYQPFISAVQTTKDISVLDIYSKNETFLFAHVQYIDEEIEQSDWYKKSMDNRMGGNWATYTNPFQLEPVFSFRKRLNHFDKTSPVVASIEVKKDVLYDLIKVEGQNKRFIFTLQDGSVLLDSLPTSKVARLDQLPFHRKIEESVEGSFSYHENGVSYQIIYKTLNSRNVVKSMKVIAFVPVSDLALQSKPLRSLSLILFLVAVVLSLLLIAIISFGLTRRLTELSFKMKRLHKDNFQSYIEVRGRDEVAQLGEMFNLMVERLRQLVHEVYQSEIDRQQQELRTKEVELYALQTQINPHFLFNVLNMIRGKLLIVGERDTAKVVGLLAKSFRMMLKSGGQRIPLSGELEFIDIYLQIQQYRFGEKLTFSIDVPVEYQAILIPKLCIQPLVENAVSHGIEMNPLPAHISITSKVVGETLHILVDDNGVGMTLARLAEVEQWLREDDTLAKDAHIGLRNVHNRLKHHYGDPYGLKVWSEEGVGTKITITLPLDHETGGKHDV